MWRFIVIGGGIAGASAAYHLAKLGRTLLLERENQPGYHSTGRSAALYSQAYGNAPVRALTVGSEAFYKAPPPGFVDHPLLTPRGSLFVAAPGQEAVVEKHIADTRLLVPSVRMIERAEAFALCPVLRPEQVAAAGFEPEAEDIDVSALHQGYLRGLRAAGGTVMTDAEVLGIEGGTGGWSVRLKDATVASDVLVNAAGAWAPLVGSLAGLRVPVVTVRHQLQISTPIAGIAPTEPIARITDAGAYLRPAGGGLMSGRFEPDPLVMSPPPGADFTMDDVPIDGDVLASCADLVGDLAPAVRSQSIAQQRGGLFTMSPDGHFLVGPAPGVSGFWLATGCNGSGFSMASGIGLTLAEWMLGGEPPFDLSSLDPSRLMPQTLSDEDLTAAGVWQYENYYTPHAEQPQPAS